MKLRTFLALPHPQLMLDKVKKPRVLCESVSSGKKDAQ